MQKRKQRKAGQHIVHVLATNVRVLRHAKGLSQEELADLAGLHRTYIGSIERGERNATLSTLEVLAGVFGVSVPELLTPQKADARNSTS